MSRLSDLVRGWVSGWSFTSWSFTSWNGDRSSQLCLTMLLIYQITWSALCLAGGVAQQPVLWPGLPASLRPVPSDTDLLLLIAACSLMALQLSAALLLLWRRCVAVQMSLILQWGSTLIGAVIVLRSGELSSFRAMLSALVDVSMTFAVGMTAFLLTSPQLRLVSRAPLRPSRLSDIGQADTFASAIGWGRRWPGLWLWLLIVIWALMSLSDALHLQRDHVDLLQATLSLALPAALQHHVPLLINTGANLLTAIMLICYRRWLSIQVTLLCLWGWALYYSSVWVVHYAIHLPDILSLIDMDPLLTSHMLTRMTESHLLYLNKPAAALAWTGYLLSSPYVRVRYPGGRQRGMTEVGADVF
jgi:hypothetical protein